MRGGLFYLLNIIFSLLNISANRNTKSAVNATFTHTVTAIPAALIAPDSTVEINSALLNTGIKNSAPIIMQIISFKA